MGYKSVMLVIVFWSLSIIAYSDSEVAQVIIDEPLAIDLTDVIVEGIVTEIIPSKKLDCYILGIYKLTVTHILKGDVNVDDTLTIGYYLRASPRSVQLGDIQFVMLDKYDKKIDCPDIEGLKLPGGIKKSQFWTATDIFQLSESCEKGETNFEVAICEPDRRMYSKVDGLYHGGSMPHEHEEGCPVWRGDYSTLKHEFKETLKGLPDSLYKSSPLIPLVIEVTAFEEKAFNDPLKDDSLVTYGETTINIIEPEKYRGKVLFVFHDSTSSVSEALRKVGKKYAVDIEEYFLVEEDSLDANDVKNLKRIDD